MIEDGVQMDDNGEPYAVYTVTSKGLEWLLENQSRFQLRVAEKEETPIKEEDIPF